MKTTALKGFAAITVAALATTTALANDDHRGRRARTYDVCVNAGSDARFLLSAVDFGGNPSQHPGPGDRVSGVGMILPRGTIPSDGSGDPTCNAFQHLKIGTFWVSGTFVSTFDGAPVTDRLPQAAADDLAYVQWHFRVNGAGSFETSGPIKQFVQNGTYPQVLTGGTGRFRGAKGELVTEMLGAGGFQIRVYLPQD